MTRSGRTLILLQLAALVVLGAVVTWRHHVWAPIDERAHYDYVQKLVEEERIPRPTDLVSLEVQAITDGTWPDPSPISPASISLGGRSYEAIQPPLYYFAAAPAWALPVDHLAKVYVLRVFDLLLLGLAVWLLWILARRMVPEPLASGAFALALVVVLWPGVLVRSVTAGNTPLELVLVAAVLLALWLADAEPDRRGPAIAASVLVGFALLTKLALVYLVPVFLLVLARRLRADRSPGRLAGAAGLAAIPPLMLAPWFALNLSRYDSLTVNIEGGAGVVGQVAPAGWLDRAAGLWPRNSAMVGDGVLPQEFWEQLDVWWVGGLTAALGWALPLAAVVLLWLRRADWAVWFLMLPAIVGLLTTNAVFLLTGNEPFLLRYVYAALPPLALGVGIAAARVFARGGVVPAAAAAASLAVAALWVDMAGAFYFTDVGDRLGI